MYYLYKKTHNITGMQYLGYTSRNDPHKYTGSGKYWLRHLRKHGFLYSTEIILKTDEIEQLVEVAKKLSEEWNIVESKQWANLKIESGDGGFNQELCKIKVLEKYGVDNVMKDEEISKKCHEKRKKTIKERYGVDNVMEVQCIKEKMISTINSSEWNEKIGNGMREKQQKVKDSEEWKTKTGKKIKETKSSLEWKNKNSTVCEHCLKTVDNTNYKRWHGDYCKKNPNKKEPKKIFCRYCEKNFSPGPYANFHGERCKKNNILSQKPSL